MKISRLVFSAFLITTAAFASPVESVKKSVNIGRVVQLHTLVSKPGLQVSVVVEDLGGSTDVGPTQTAYLTLYSKGEMFSTDATFELGSFYQVKSASRKSGGIYEIVAQDAESMENVRVTVDARAAVTAIQAVRCDDFDCDASAQFKSAVDVTTKKL